MTHVLCATLVGTHNAAVASMTTNTVALGAARRCVCAVMGLATGRMDSVVDVHDVGVDVQVDVDMVRSVWKRRWTARSTSECWR